MSDFVIATWGGFLEIDLRDGWHGLLRIDHITQVLPRGNGGGASIRCLWAMGGPKKYKSILVDVPAGAVIDAIRKASDINGGTDEIGD